MSMAAALLNVFSPDRQRSRFQSERVHATDADDDLRLHSEEQSRPSLLPSAAAPVATTVSDVPRVRSTGNSLPRQQNNTTGTATTIVLNEDNHVSTVSDVTTNHSPTRSTNTEDDEVASPDDYEVDGFTRFTAAQMTAAAATRTTTMSLAELEEERELARRRSSACILLSTFVLFRLWVLAIEEKDFGLLLLCLVGTSWTVRWIGHNREREEELNRRIATYLEGPGGTDGVDRNELRMLSFQAQLALAIMESQRQLMQGGFGHPDGGAASQGVSEEAKSKWERYKYSVDAAVAEKTKGGYGSVSQKDEKGLYEEPHCSICLSEYENGDDVVKLPCNHLYHDECISSWTQNHIKCPLCNLDLETVVVAASSSALAGSASLSLPNDSIV